MGLPSELRGKYVPPPNQREEAVQAYAHCPDPRCQGSRQELADAVLQTTEWTIASRGGGDDGGGVGSIFLHLIENTTTLLKFVDPRDLQCAHCGKSRELSTQLRPSYPIQMGGANALLRLQDMGVGFDPDKQRQIAAGAPESPTDLLQRRYINDEITDAEFAAKRSALSGVVAIEAPGGQDDRIAALEAKLAQLLGTDDPPKRGPGRPRKDPDA